MSWPSPITPVFAVLQSTNCCYDKSYVLFVLNNNIDSIAAMVEKAQHDSHLPWCLTEVVMPFKAQSTSFDAFVNETVALFDRASIFFVGKSALVDGTIEKS